MAIEIDRRGVSHATRRGVARGVSPDRGIAIAIGRVGVIGCPNPLRRAGEGVRFRQSRPGHRLPNEASRVVGVRGWRRSRAAGGGWRARVRKQYGAVHGWPRAREARPGGMGDDGWMGGRRARARADKYYKIFKEGVHTTR